MGIYERSFMLYAFITATLYLSCVSHYTHHSERYQSDTTTLPWAAEHRTQITISCHTTKESTTITPLTSVIKNATTKMRFMT